ncbi:lysine decarboxylase LdcC, partial [Klebsiella pneumoniae]|nr:lysine decarboxylase LdcC [Klebsiella pneumoniae]
PRVRPGERLPEESRPVLEVLQMRGEIGAHSPGFETDSHGAYRQADGSFTVKVLKEENNKLYTHTREVDCHFPFSGCKEN